MKFECCPVCGQSDKKAFKQELMPHPYVQCEWCSLVYQPNMGGKVYEAQHESRGDSMSDYEKQVNKDLAAHIVSKHLGKLPVTSLRSLDIGSKYPYLASCLKNYHQIDAYGMDAIPEVDEFGKALGVPMFQADFESERQTWTEPPGFSGERFNLVTLIHCLEHFYEPLVTLKKIRVLMETGGVLYVRSPDSDSPNIDRDFTSGHYSIHPVIWNSKSLYEALYKIKDCFIVLEESALYGQKDWVLKAIDRKPRIYAGYIVKNEERDLPKSLETLKGVVDLVCVRDTGSTDNTKAAVEESGLPYDFETYFGASQLDENNDWKLWDFGKARNQFVQFCDKYADWILWMDADDTLSAEAAKTIPRLVYAPVDIIGFPIYTGINFHTHHRLWRAGHGVHFQGACHEYPKWPETFKESYAHTPIVHSGEEGLGESSINRNLRILREAVKIDPTSRNIFYLANTWSELARVVTGDKKEEALTSAEDHYRKYLEAPGFLEEEMCARLYLARTLRVHGKTENSLEELKKALAKDSDYAELHMELAYIEFDQKNYWGSVASSVKAYHSKMSRRLFTEKDKYTDQPMRLLTHNFMALGFPDVAVSWGRMVLDIVPQDKAWSTFLSSTKKVVNLLRPGALGDVLMTGWIIKGIRDQYPDHKICYYTKALEIAKLLDVDEVWDADFWTKRIPGVDHILIGYPLHEGYPHAPMKKHIIQYLAEQVGVKAQRPILKIGNVVHKEKYMTLHTKAGWSPYKNWPTENWERLVEELISIYGGKVLQVGAIDDPEVKGCVDYRGKSSIEQTTALIKNAWIHLGVDSFTNHVAGVFGVPSVILFGSTSPKGSGYSHALNIWKALPCSPCYKEDPKISQVTNGICENPPNQTYEEPKHQCLHSLTAEEVLEQAKPYIDKIIERKPQTVHRFQEQI